VVAEEEVEYGEVLAELALVLVVVEVAQALVVDKEVKAHLVVEVVLFVLVEVEVGEPLVVDLTLMVVLEAEEQYN
jgi:hypothetical protein